MAICKPERQPGRHFALSDENLLVGVGHLVVGCRHRIASRASGGLIAWCSDHTASCKPIETGQRPLGGLDSSFIATISAGCAPVTDENYNESLGRRQFFRDFG